MNRIELIDEIVKEFELVYNKLTNTETVVVTSVVKLENLHLAQIAKQVQKLTGAKNVRIKTAIDPSIVDGFIVEELKNKMKGSGMPWPGDEGSDKWEQA
ncbi:hypothetical protein V2J09_021282 [Rumex salicifolius]